MRERMHKLVDEVYNNHENMLRACIRSQYRNDAPDTAKLKMAIEEMEKLLMKLGHSSSVLPALKRGILLDHGSIVDYFANLKTRERREVFDKYV